MLLEAVGSRSAKATVWSFCLSACSASWNDLSEAAEELVELQVVSCISLTSVSYGSVAGCDFSDGSILSGVRIDCGLLSGIYKTLELR